MKQNQEENKEENIKETVTTVESILKGQELKQFNQAVKVWQTMPKSALAMLSKMETIGHALNTLYDKGIEKKLLKQDITVIARKAFTGLNRRERSEYRKLANNVTAIRLYVEFAGVKSANPTYLVNAWIKAMKEDFEACELIELGMRGGLDANGKPNSGGYVKVEGVNGIAIQEVPLDTKGKVIAESTPIKTGIHVESESLTGGEVTVLTGQNCNQIKTMFNKGKFNADNLTIIEQHLTSTLQHINNVDADIKLAI